MAKRSESCPRPARKEVAVPGAPVLPLSQPPVRSCTLQDLGPEDRQKVAKLLKQVVDLGQELQVVKQQRDEQAKTFAQREQDLLESNRQLHKENQTLKKKLGQVLLVLRTSQAKVNALEASQQTAIESKRSVQVQTDAVPMCQERGPATYMGCVSTAIGAGDSPAHTSQQQGAAVGHTNAAAKVPLACAPETVAARSQQLTSLQGNAKPDPGLAASQPALLPSSGHSNSNMTAVLDSAGLRSSLSAPASIPHLMHVASGAHVNITINHAPEAAGSVPTTQPAAAPNLVTPSGYAAKVADVGGQEHNSATPGWKSHESSEGPAATASKAVAGQGREVAQSVLTDVPAAAARITIPTSTEMVAVASVVSSNASASVALPERSDWSPSPPAEDRQGARRCQWVGPEGQVSDSAVAQASAGAPQKGAAVAVRTGAGNPCRTTRPRSILVDATMQQFEAVPVHEVLIESQEAPTASPMIVPPSAEVVAAASSLLGWQAQNGLDKLGGASGPLPAAAGGTAGPFGPGARDQRPGRKVLSYDPAIGKAGAFYFVDVDDQQVEPPPPVVALVPSTRQPAIPPAATSVHGQPRGQVRYGEPMSWDPPRWRGDSGAALPAARPEPASAGPRVAHATVHIHRGEPKGLGETHAWLHQSQPAPPPSNCEQQLSPCGSVLTDSTAALTPFSGAGTGAFMQVGDTPAGSIMSLSRMAVVLDEVAWQQRWDVQAPAALAQHDEPASSSTEPGPGVALARGLRSGLQSARQGAAMQGAMNGPGGRLQRQCGPYAGAPTQKVRRQLGASADHASATLFGSRGDLLAPEDQAPSERSLASMGTSRLIEQYDESLVDILSQADEELEQQLPCNGHSTRSRQMWPQRRNHPPATAAGLSTARNSSIVPNGIPPERFSCQHKHKTSPAVSLEALLASNIYEENDVLSVILEQEDFV